MIEDLRVRLGKLELLRDTTRDSYNQLVGAIKELKELIKSLELRDISPLEKKD